QVLVGPHLATIWLLPLVAVQVLFFLFRFGLQSRAAWVAGLLTGPTRLTLKLTSLLYSGGLILVFLFMGDPEGPIGQLAAFVAIQLIWHGLVSRHYKYGFQLFLLDWMALVSWTNRHAGAWTISNSTVLGTLSLLIAVQVFQAALEFRRPWYDYLKPLLVPFQGWSTLIACASLWLLVSQTILEPKYTTLDFGLCCVALALSARALSSGPIALLAVLAGYFAWHADSMRTSMSAAEMTTLLASPVRVSLLAFILAALGHVGKRIHEITPRVVSGAFTPKWLKS